MRQADAAITQSWRNDPVVRHNTLGFRFPITQEREEVWFERILRDTGQNRADFAIECVADDALVGMTHLCEIDWIARHARLGVVIGEAARQGQGYAAEALGLLFDYAFNILNLRRIHLQVASYNRRALALYARLGFIEEGRLREHVYLDDGYHDLILMGLMRADCAPPSATGSA
ncbi:putative N-acetyltransferase GCN5 [Magnetofaba australis IT-1]|uniref:Putative N-acetyltransferase GCN5 n=1 Tax=Magnetofaba australis IT-1 TaxID=1434232 RepID=A0A1Y2K2W0_9PROT|nr:putative N-acetyltransferase GCN5 [Magnetofaba australis IT-1]